jgi:uncharacterized repeat protein (TIGR01451 family)
VGLCVLGANAFAQPEGRTARGALELSTAVEKIIETHSVDGVAKTELVAVTDVGSGDALVYTVSFTNVSGRVADHVRITSPVPPEVRYVADSAFAPGSDVLYSIDGGRSYGAPNELTVAGDDGTRRSAAADDYTNIRWIMKAPLDIGVRGFARFRAVVR